MSSGPKVNYRLVSTKTFIKEIEKLDKQTNQRIVNSIEALLPENMFVGKALRGELKGLFSLRVGDFRVIYSINAPSREIILHGVKHRSKVYEG